MLETRRLSREIPDTVVKEIPYMESRLREATEHLTGSIDELCLDIRHKNESSFSRDVCDVLGVPGKPNTEEILERVRTLLQSRG